MRKLSKEQNMHKNYKKFGLSFHKIMIEYKEKTKDKNQNYFFFKEKLKKYDSAVVSNLVKILNEITCIFRYETSNSLYCAFNTIIEENLIKEKLTYTGIVEVF